MKREKERGIIGLLVVLVVGLILAKYLFNWSIFTAAESQQGQETVSYTHELFSNAWYYIKLPFVFIWQRIHG